MAKAIAIIPARGGSKRIPRKNIKSFHGKPLIAYSIETALEAGIFDKVIVSTDDEEIATVAKSYGAEVPFIRPKELSDDFSGTQDVIDHALQWLESHGAKYDFACTIYATAPLLQAHYLKDGLEALQHSDAVNAFSATSMPFPIQRTFKLNENGRCEMFTPKHYMTRSQDLEEAYQDAGQFYWTKLGKKSDKIMFGEDSIPVILPRHLVQDIDTAEDWERAEKLYSILHQDEFDKWNHLKKSLHTKQQPIGFRAKDILFVSVGKNVGYEILGKGDEYLRPVLVVKKFGQYSFFGVPLSTKTKEGFFYFNFCYKKDIVSTALLSQAKMFDSRRIKYRSGQIHQKDFDALINQLMRVITPLPDGRGSD
jgi:pseudaminic acid cytidylyltransferase